MPKFRPKRKTVIQLVLESNQIYRRKFVRVCIADIIYADDHNKLLLRK